MAILTEYIVLIWLLPATLFLLLPLCALITQVIFTAAKNTASQLRKLWIRQRRNKATNQTSELRKVSRKATTELRAEISDGRSSYRGLVANISQEGVCIKDIPDTFSNSRKLLSIIVRTTTTHYRLVARPCWEKHEIDRGKTIGAEIAIAPDNWKDFVLLS